MKRKHFDRRAFLRGTGQSLIALPLFHFASNSDRLIGAPGESAVTQPPRLFTLSWGTGAPPEQFNYNQLLKSLAPLKDQIVVIEHMSNPASKASLVNPHIGGAIAAFTGTPSISNGMTKAERPSSATIDQVAFAKHRPRTKLSIIQTGYSGFTDQADNGDYLDYRSFDSTGKRLDEILNDPYKLFMALFGGPVKTDPSMDAATIAAKVRRESVLDGAINQLKELNSDRYGLSAESKLQLNAHVEKLRELEMASSNPVLSSCKIPALSVSKEQGIRYSRDTQTLGEMMGLIGDIFTMGLQCDLVRYGNVCIGESAFHCRIDSLMRGVTNTDGHEAAHVAAYYPIWVDFAAYYIGIMASIMTKLKAATDIDGRSVLDNTIFYAATELSDHSKSHSIEDMPALVIGGKPHNVPTGTIIDAKNRPTTDALIAVLNKAGVPIEKLGPFGTGPLF
jgi:hypothetical protein